MVETPSPKGSTHGVHQNNFPVYCPLLTFEGYGVECVETGQVRPEAQGRENLTEGEQPPQLSTAPEPAPSPQSLALRIQPEGFLLLFTSSKIIRP